MCLLAIHYRAVPDAPILAAANREEFFDRPALPPGIQPGSPRVLCGIDTRAGGTWLAVNEHGLLAAVTNRPQANTPAEPRSRGTLCRELAACRTARQAARLALDELAGGLYAGANYVCVDTREGVVIHGGDSVEMVPFGPGLHILTNGDLDDLGDPRLKLARELFTAQPIDSAADFIAVARRVSTYSPANVPRAEAGDAAAGATPPTIVLAGADRGTVSSTLIAWTAEPADAVYLYAAGRPDRTPFDDYSPLLRALYGGSQTRSTTRSGGC